MCESGKWLPSNWTCRKVIGETLISLLVQLFTEDGFIMKCLVMNSLNFIWEFLLRHIDNILVSLSFVINALWRLFLSLSSLDMVKFFYILSWTKYSSENQEYETTNTKIKQSDVIKCSLGFASYQLCDLKQVICTLLCPHL